MTGLLVEKPSRNARQNAAKRNELSGHSKPFGRLAARRKKMTKQISLCHWGAFEAEVSNGRLVATAPMQDSGADPDMIGALPQLVYSDKRIHQPHIRQGWLQDRALSDGAGRGRERMVPVSWELALKIVSEELDRVRMDHGHRAIFAGSYGWSSAGRFHHARSQVRRFFGAFGGFTDQTGNYSWGAAQIILQHVLGSHEAVSGAATSWDSIAGNTDAFVAFGGLNPKNWRVTSGGAGFHHMPAHVQKASEQGTKFVVISPMADDIPPGLAADWIAPRPGTDTAIILGLCHEMLRRGRADHRFLRQFCAGSDTLIAYLNGETDQQPKSLNWAAGIADVPVEALTGLADVIETGRVMLSASWSLQRAHHGEQTHWALIALAAMLGQIGLPGGGFTFGYGSLNAVGQGARKGLVPSLPSLGNKAGMSIPVARFADMLEHPGAAIPFNGHQITFPDTKLIYWAGGNPFHHAQDLFRLDRLWAKPQTIIVHEQFWTATAQRADIVLPATTTLERSDIGGSSRDPHVFYMPKLIDPVGQARNDFEIFSDLAGLLGFKSAFTEARDEAAWLRHLWSGTEAKAKVQGLCAPSFDELVRKQIWHVPLPDKPEVYLSEFRQNRIESPLLTDSGKIELASTRIASFQYENFAGHPAWSAPSEWLGDAAPDELALLTRQPAKFLHSQLGQTQLAKDHPPIVCMHPFEADQRGLKEKDLVRVSSPRGACLAQVARMDTCRHGIAVMETGPWYEGNDAGMDHGGNPNAMTLDIGTSPLSQATSAQTCLVMIEPYTKEQQEQTR